MENNNNCTICDRITPREELKENAKFSTSGFKEVCNPCSEVLDTYVDNQLNDR